VARAVELRPDLAYLGGHEFIVVNRFLFTDRIAGRQAWNDQAPATFTKSRRILLVDFAERCDFAKPHELHGT
jgi:hypothetical protein